MVDFVKLACPSCGGTLTIPDNVGRLACSYCGTELIAQRNEGVLTISPIVDALKRVQAGIDKTASELAMKRLREEIGELTSTRQRVSSEYENSSRAIATREAQIRAIRQKARKEALKGLIQFVCAILLIIVLANVVDRMHPIPVIGPLGGLVLASWALVSITRQIGRLEKEEGRKGIVLLCWWLPFSIWKKVSHGARSIANRYGVSTDLVQARDEARQELTRLEEEIAHKNLELEKHLKIVST